MEPIAIAGIGCKLPGGVNSPAAFWAKLLARADLVTDTPPDRWNIEANYHPDRAVPGRTYSRWGGYVSDPAAFDAGFFGLTPREVVRMDPQQRWLLETAWEAIQDAGYPLAELAGSGTGVYVGISSCDYGDIQKRGRYDADMHTSTGGALSIASNRVSYTFDLRGPSFSVDTACSSALVALDLACRAIWRDGLPLALVGGANAILQPDVAVAFSKAGMLSPTGRCRAFDASADGFVRAEGAAFVVLKPLARSLADGDRVYAVIRSTVVNQDGRTGGLTVPSEAQQAAMLAQAYLQAGIAPSQVGYVEAHGTGTPVGDPIEASAIGRVLGASRPADRPLWLGSVKSNIGHLEPASGMAGLIKLALSIHHGTIPPNVHFRTPNPRIPFEKYRLRVPTEAIPFAPADDGLVYGGVNSFGFGGTNAHAVLSSIAPSPVRPKSQINGPIVWTVSGRSAAALTAAAAADAAFIDQSDPDRLGELAAVAQTRRTHHPHRAAIVAEKATDLAEALRGLDNGSVGTKGLFSGTTGNSVPSVAVVFSGQGTQWPGMARDLFERDCSFRSTIQELDELLNLEWGRSLIAEIRRGDESVFRSDVGQPILFAIQLGIYRWLQTRGIRPVAFLGHSVGEVAAAVAAGALSLADAARVMVHRSRAQETTRGTGAMAAVGISEAAFLAEFSGRLHVAAVNSPTDLTLAGKEGAVRDIVEALTAKGMFARLLPFPYAFHSPAMDPCRDGFLAVVGELSPSACKLPFISTVTGTELSGSDLDASYWWRNVREPVRFAAGVRRAADLGAELFIEVGPHPGLLRYIQKEIVNTVVVPTLRRDEDGLQCLAETVAALHSAGVKLDWLVGENGRSSHVDLPRHPWQKQVHWAEGEYSRRRRLAGPVHPLLGTREPGPIHQWEVCLSSALFEYLPDHGFRTRAVLPAAAHLEIMLAAAAEGSFAEPVGLDDVNFDRALWTDQPVIVRTSLDSTGRQITVSARTVEESDRGWEDFSRGARRSVDPGEGAAPALNGRIPPADVQPEEPEALYGRFGRAGHHYGPLFRTVCRLWAKENEAWAEVTLPPALHSEAARYYLHPGILDGVLQAALRTTPIDEERDVMFLPLRVDRVEWRQRAGTSVICHIKNVRIQDVRWFADIDIFSPAGEWIATLSGCCCATKSQDAHLTRSETQAYRERWLATPRIVEVGGSSTKWLVIDPASMVGDLVRRLSEFDRFVGHEVEPTETVMREFISRAGEGGTVVLWAATGLAEMELPSVMGVIRCLNPLLKIARALASDKSSSLTLWVVASGATFEHTGPSSKPNLLQAPLAGVLRTVASELPNVTCRLLDLDPTTPEDHIDIALDEITEKAPEDEIAYRRGERFAAQLMPTNPDALPWRAITAARSSYELRTLEPGSLDGLAWVEIPDAEPAAHEIEVEVRAVGLNFRDVLKALDIYPLAPTEPRSFGDECAGVIVRVGHGVTVFQSGDEVVAIAVHGFGNRVRIPAALAAKKPKNLTFEQAATIPIAFLTAEYCLANVARLEAGESVLIHAAAGGVGQAAIQVARRLGGVVFATASPEKHEFLRSQGVRHIFHSRNLSFADGVRESTAGQGVDVVLNSLSGDFIPRSLEILKPDGRFVEIGKKDIFQNSALNLHPFRSSLSFHAVDLAGVIARKPAWIGKQLRGLMDRFASGEYAPLPSTPFSAGRVADAFRLMAQGKHRGKLVVTSSPVEQPEQVICHQRPIVRANASYLVTGGLSGLGLRTADWLANQGAKWLVLAGRSGVSSDAAQETIASLTERGVRVEAVACDVCNASAVAHLIQSTGIGRPPLRGVIHSAMVLRDEPIARVDPIALEAVLAPKVAGAWNLHLATRDLPLDWFVMYSSVATLLGSAGQASYVAANRFLDALAWHRRAEGLPALAVNWGPLADVGVVADNSALARYLESVGLGLLSLEDVFGFLKFLLRRDAISIGVARIDWTKYAAANPSAGRSRRLAAVMQQRSGGTAAASSSDATAAVLARPVGERLAYLIDHLRRGLATVLRADETAIDPAVPLTNFGVDSLMAFEFKLRIDRDFKSNVPIDQLSAGTTLTGLAEILLRQLTAAPSSVDAETQLPIVSSLPEPTAAEEKVVVANTHSLLPSNEFLRVCTRSEANGSLEKLRFDAAALLYVPDRVSTVGGLSEDQIRGLFGTDPFLSHLYELPYGRIGIVTLPIRGREMFGSPRISGLIRKAGELARDRGVKCLSLTGLIPSATDYGRSVRDWLGTGPSLRVTTGHATTTAAVVLNLESMLDRGGRCIDREHVAVLGLGSIGQSCLALMLDVLPHPIEITLCDVFSKRDELESIAERSRGRHGYRGTIRVLSSSKGLPDELYEATTILTAVSVPDVMDIDRIRPGTVVVDDSYPPGFPLERAIRRAEESADLLFGNAGMLRLQNPIHETVFLPPGAEELIARFGTDAFLRELARDPRELTACVLSALLTDRFEGFRATVGLADPVDLIAHYHGLARLQIEAARPQCGTYFMPDDLIQRFRERFANRRTLIPTHR